MALYTHNAVGYIYIYMSASAHSVCVGVLCVSLSVFIRVWTALDFFTYVLRVVIWTSLKNAERQREKKREAITTASRMYHQKEKKK